MANGNVGSGSLISRNSVITNYHVVEGSSGATISFPSGQRVQGQVIATDPVYDLAILRVPNTGIEPPEINDTDPTGPLCAGGFGGDGRFLAVRGTVTGHVVYDGASIPCPKMRGVNRPGDSGGGVVNQSKQFVGVQWGSRDGEVYITSGRPLARFLDSVFPYRTGAIVPRATPIARRSGGSVGRPPLEPIQPIPTTEPDPGPEIDYEAWEQWQEEIRQQQAQTQQQLQSLMIKIDGIKGEPGPAGPQGPPGPAGISPQIDYDELAEAVAARLTHSATITLLDGTRKTQTRPLNEPLEFIQHSRAKTPE
jgi:hypothetical protein